LLVLLLLAALSVWQYADKGQVTWLTDSLRWAEARVASMALRAQQAAEPLLRQATGNAGPLPGALREPAVPPGTDLLGDVVAVIDGDTIDVIDRARVRHKVRLSGIDAPEGDQAFGQAAQENLARMVAGKSVRVEHSKLDQYGRVLGKVWVQPADCPRCGMTLDANHAQLLAGMAWWYRYYAQEQSPEDRGRYESAEDEARARRWGLWSDPYPINPYDWRKGRR
jgi:endonuclease YncB( thermonuclease family)